jgi:hypothetical protein
VNNDLRLVYLGEAANVTDGTSSDCGVEISSLDSFFHPLRVKWVFQMVSLNKSLVFVIQSGEL